MQRSGLCGDLTGRRQIGQGTYLLGVGRLQLKKLTLQLVNFDLPVRLEHRSGQRNRQSDDDHHRRPTRRRRGTPALGYFGTPWSTVSVGRTSGGTARRTSRVDTTWKADDTHGATFRAARRRAERARGLRAISPTLANWALALNTRTRGIAPQTQPSSREQ